MALAPPAATADTTTADTSTDMGEGQSDIIVTIARGADGGYVVYQGDEPEGGGGAGGGQQVDSIGAALKEALDFLNEDASSAGAPGSSQDQFMAGYNSPQAPIMAQTRRRVRQEKYVPERHSPHFR
jgi:hypothetical protein